MQKFRSLTVKDLLKFLEDISLSSNIQVFDEKGELKLATRLEFFEDEKVIFISHVESGDEEAIYHLEKILFNLEKQQGLEETCAWVERRLHDFKKGLELEGEAK